MSRFIITGKLSNGELNIIRKESMVYKEDIHPATIYSSKFIGVNRDVRDSLTAILSPGSAHRTFNILQSIILEHYSHLKLNITNTSEVQYSKYGVGGKFVWHNDIVPTGKVLVRGLTLSVQLTDPSEYDGGALQIKDGKNIIDVDTSPGAYVIFPSYTRHRVTELTRGYRESLVAWVHMSPKEIQWLKTNDK